MSDDQQVLDALGMSDEDFINAPLESFETPEVEQEEDEARVEPELEAEAEEDEAQPESDEADDEEGGDAVGGTVAESGQEGTQNVPTPKEPVLEETQQEENSDPDFKAVYDRLFTPFRANGKEIKIGSVDDAVALMQMGANYNKKMAALKPNLKLMKVLENNDLLSEEKIGFLIDLSKKDPAAITKLIKDSGIDPLDVDVDQAKEYAPKTYAVDDREIELDQVLDEIQDTPTYSRTISLVSNKWDAHSKQAIADSPQLLKVINAHMATGIYDLISAEVERERVFGRLGGLSDIQAYQQVGDAINARGGFNNLVNQNIAPQPSKQVVAPLSKPSTPNPEVKDKKRAASSPKAATPKGKEPDFNPLAMSDEEFSKLINEKLM